MPLALTAARDRDMGVDERSEAFHLLSTTSARVADIGQCDAPSPHCLRSRRRWHHRKERLLQAYNVSARSINAVAATDVESHAPDVGSRDNLTLTPRLFRGCCMASASSTSRCLNNATCPHDEFITAALQRASPTVLTAASLHKFSNSIIPPQLQLLHKGLYHSRSQQSIQYGI
ncbi:hypothetical protein M422DRAFT_254675 [Sphaerobolus stellatus SS14]|uniref:Unplaced genomic scaffold SPHSTscaffold_56, whole genome shotgun sequence n=1 Tax=Sphaerobolus stellatus (strain SS14) TaxID=990650 RepID=A0A0C9VUK3_SPHS4|nr:hypothetical protein M422DRAFT_254675 [Sphaerobolus stellatus SS14]